MKLNLRGILQNIENFYIKRAFYFDPNCVFTLKIPVTCKA